ncbi:hypothetical protein [Nonomuraea turcica]|uniref:hypothetical protein n=1 Tax=Nonomuraea sp. G32 TaxID=3067274 RepID=UPI00273C8E14|nr:hypothetical protein [Nonomuraea sp. G32]MDP4501171.1 hypothetical protein [Nonomuraea sp. G32]
MRKHHWPAALLIGLALTACADTAPKERAVSPGSPAAVEARLPEGTYRTSPVGRDRIEAVLEEGGFDAKEIEGVTGRMSSQDRVVFTLKAQGGRWTQFQSVNGGPGELGWSGTYRVIDLETVAATDACGTVTYTYQLSGDQLRLKMTEDTCEGMAGDSRTGELMAQTMIYHSAPFEKVS